MLVNKLLLLALAAASQNLLSARPDVAEFRCGASLGEAARSRCARHGRLSFFTKTANCKNCTTSTRQRQSLSSNPDNGTMADMKKMRQDQRKSVDTAVFFVLLFSAVSVLVFFQEVHAQPETESLAGGGTPFDDLTAEEIRITVRIINASYPPATRPSLRFSIIRTEEPPKPNPPSTCLSGAGADSQRPCPRLAYAAVFDIAAYQLTEFVVDLNAINVVSRQYLPPGVAPPVLQAENDEAERLVRGNKDWLAGLSRRGLDPQRARLRIWGVAPNSNVGAGAGYLLRVVTNYQDEKSRFWYWVVVEGLIATVDPWARVVLSVWDDAASATVNLTTGYKELSSNGQERLLKPLLIKQPAGSSIHVRGQQITWYKWKLRYSVDPLYGLQLYHVSYAADCEQQRHAVAYKISLGEILVPYGPEARGWRWRVAFDVGYRGVGKLATRLRRGVDVPENARLFPCLLVDEATGEPRSLPACVGAYEKDAGLLYKHVDSDKGTGSREAGTDARRGRVLVLTMMTSVGNYDYAFDYVLHMDGLLEVRTRLTGIVLTRGVATRVNDPNCVQECVDLLNEFLTGPIHQHFFSYRIDLDVDGPLNHVLQVDVKPGGEDGAFVAKKKVIWTETGADLQPRAHRTWHVVNPGSRNRFGSPRGYALRPSASLAFPFDKTAARTVAPFLKHPFWVTRYHDDEQTPGAKFPRSPASAFAAGGVGVARYVQDNESVGGQDSVLWYTFGVTHQTRPEEWPIMNVHDAPGFELVPFNFASHNGEMALENGRSCSASA